MTKLLKHLFIPIVFVATACSTTQDDLIDTDITPEPPQISQEVINPQYVDVFSSKVLLYNENEYDLENNTTTQKLSIGSVAIVNCDGEHRIIVIEDIRSNDASSIHVKARRGDLCDIFANTTLYLSSQNTVDSRSEMNGCYLTKVEIQNNNGDFIGFSPSSRTQTSITSELWKWESEDLSEEERTICKSENSRLWLSELNAALDLDINLTLSFGARETVQETIQDIFEQYRSQELAIRGILKGSFSFLTTLSAEVFGSLSYQEDDDELIVHNVVKPIRLTFTTPSGIPIQATLNADLRRGANLKADGNIRASFGAKLNASLENGFDWKQASGMAPVSDANFTPEFIPPAIEGYGKITGKAWLYPRIFVTLYEIVGPSFDIIPYIGTELSGGFKNTIENSTDDFVALNLRSFTGVDFDAGLSLKRMNYETYRQSLGRFNIFESDIYESPSTLKTIAGQDLVPTVGIPITYTIGIYDYFPWFQKEQLTPLPHIITIETSDPKFKSYQTAINGKVDVSWIPQNENDYLQVSLYSPNGSLLDRLIYNVGVKEDPGYIDNSTYDGQIQILSCRYIGAEAEGDGTSFNYAHDDKFKIRFRLKNYTHWRVSYYSWAKNIKAVGYGDGIRLITSPNDNLIKWNGSEIWNPEDKPLPDGVYEIELLFSHYGYDYTNKETPYFWFWLFSEDTFLNMSNKAIKVKYDGTHFSKVSGEDLPQEIIDEIKNRVNN